MKALINRYVRYVLKSQITTLSREASERHVSSLYLLEKKLGSSCVEDVQCLDTHSSCQASPNNSALVCMCRETHFQEGNICVESEYSFHMYIFKSTDNPCYLKLWLIYF